MREVDIQSQMVRDVGRDGGFAYKASNRFLIGVPDLFIQMPGFPSCQIEVKKLDKYPKSGVIPVDLTAHQRNHLCRLQEAGGYGGWLVAVKDGRDWIIFAHADTRMEKIRNSGKVFDMLPQLKSHGKPWPVKGIVAVICAECNARRPKQ